MALVGKKLIAGLREILSIIKVMKPADKRPRKSGWAPGDYMNRCMKCECHFIGDKRAIICADCAYG